MVNGAPDKELQSFLNSMWPGNHNKGNLATMRLDLFGILTIRAFAGRLSAQGARDASQSAITINRARRRGRRRRRRSEAGLVRRQVDAADIGHPKMAGCSTFGGFDRQDRFSTPTAFTRPETLERTWFSRAYYNSPMPHAHLLYHGFAIHGSYDIADGRTASHGCVRFTPRMPRCCMGMVEQEGPGQYHDRGRRRLVAIRCRRDTRSG